jgi:hypothetical protein
MPSISILNSGGREVAFSAARLNFKGKEVNNNMKFKNFAENKPTKFKENSTVATATNVKNRHSVKNNKPEFKSKSDAMRALFAEGKTVTEVCKIVDVGYAFAYGVAKRAKLNLTAANRRPTKAVKIDGENNTVTVMTDKGPVVINKEGIVTINSEIKIVRSKSKKATTK